MSLQKLLNNLINSINNKHLFYCLLTDKFYTMNLNKTFIHSMLHKQLNFLFTIFDTQLNSFISWVCH